MKQMLQRNFTIAIAILGSVACSSQYRKETAGVAAVNIGKTSEASDIELQGVAVKTKHDQLQVSFLVTTPRAMELQYELRCPGGERSGTIGEDWQAFRSRRLAELERARQQEVNTKAAFVSAIVGQAEGRAQVETPNAQVDVRGEVDGRAVGEAVGESTTAAAELPAWEVGAQLIEKTLVLGQGEAGRCVMRLWSPEDAQTLEGVTGSITVVQLTDKARVKREERALADKAAIELRAEIHASLVASGADPHRREKLRAEAERKERAAAAIRIAKEEEKRRVALQLRQRTLRLERERALKAAARRKQETKATVVVRKEKKQPRKSGVSFTAATDVDLGVKVSGDAAARIRLDAEAQVKAHAATRAAMTTRGRLQAACIGNGADLGYRARQRQAEYNRQQDLELEREERARVEVEQRRGARLIAEQQVRYDLTTRATIVATLIGFGADPDYRRKKDLADLRAFEARVRDAQGDQLREHNASVSADAAVTLTSEASESHVGSLVVRTNVTRPPMPSAPSVARPKRPSASASWIAGFFQWDAGAWLWTPGLWSVPPVQGAIWVPTVEIQLGGSVILQPGSWRTRSGGRVKRRTRRSR